MTLKGSMWRTVDTSGNTGPVEHDTEQAAHDWIAGQAADGRYDVQEWSQAYSEWQMYEFQVRPADVAPRVAS